MIYTLFINKQFAMYSWTILCTEAPATLTPTRLTFSGKYFINKNIITNDAEPPATDIIKRGVNILPVTKLPSIILENNTKTAFIAPHLLITIIVTIFANPRRKNGTGFGSTVSTVKKIIPTAVRRESSVILLFKATSTW